RRGADDRPGLQLLGAAPQPQTALTHTAGCNRSQLRDLGRQAAPTLRSPCPTPPEDDRAKERESRSQGQGPASERDRRTRRLADTGRRGLRQDRPPPTAQPARDPLRPAPPLADHRLLRRHLHRHDDGATLLKTDLLGSAGANSLYITQTLPAGASLEAGDKAA